MAKAPKYTRAQFWFMILFSVGIAAMLVGAWQRERHLLKLGLLAFSASMTWGCCHVMRKMWTNGDIYLQGWGLIEKARNPGTWVGLWVALSGILLMAGSGALFALLSLA